MTTDDGDRRDSTPSDGLVPDRKRHQPEVKGAMQCRGHSLIHGGEGMGHPGHTDEELRKRGSGMGAVHDTANYGPKKSERRWTCSFNTRKGLVVLQNGMDVQPVVIEIGPPLASNMTERQLADLAKALEDALNAS